MELCRTPSISIGVLHEGKVVFRRIIGLRDAENNLEADSDTSYHLGSVSKLFTTAAVSILTDTGGEDRLNGSRKVSWNDLIRDHLPSFDPAGDAEIGKRATLTDASRHTTGLGNPSAAMFAPSGTVSIAPQDHVAMVNSLPTIRQDGQRFRRWWYYSSATYGLLAEVVATASGMPFSSFLRERLCKPLGLDQTLLSESDVAENPNIAYPYVQDAVSGKWTRVSNEFTTDKYAAVLSTVGIRSSVNDMLAFFTAILNRYDQENGRSEGGQALLPQSHENPLRAVWSMWDCWWTWVVDDGFENETAYTRGWFRTTMPTCALNSLSYNTVREKEDVIGKESTPRVVYGHSGCTNGSLATALLLPESRSAVVVLTNAADAADASDSACQILLQALFDLKPAVDMISLVEAQVADRREDHPRILQQWRDHRDESRCHLEKDEVQGTYLGLGGTSAIHIIPSPDSSVGLAVQFSSHETSRCDLEPYNTDALGFLPEDRYDKLKRSMIDWDYWALESCTLYGQKATAAMATTTQKTRGPSLASSGSGSATTIQPCG